jgi:glycosyltransferase involved in cell wall biosynthesis
MIQKSTTLDQCQYASNRSEEFRPFFSICIPHYNRTDFFLKACESFVCQKFKNFEVCISDDCSTDGRRNDLLRFLEGSGLIFTFCVTPKNLRYDGNLRNAIGHSAGRYVFLLGNDDRLSHPEALDFIQREITQSAPVAVALTNYRDFSSNQIHRRVRQSGVLGQGPGIAVRTFRNYSFVAGTIFDGDSCRQEATDRVDGSEMYQMYLGTRLVAAGGRLLAIDGVFVDKDIQIAGQSADSYRLRPRLDPCSIVERPLPMGRLLEVVAAGLEPYHKGRRREEDLLSVARQLYFFTYPFWLIEFRRVQSWRYALGVLLALSPDQVAKGLHLSFLARLRLRLLYFIAGAMGLVVPIRAFDLFRPALYAIAKRTKRQP